MATNYDRLMDAFSDFDERGEYRTIGYVIAECESLAKQLTEMAADSAVIVAEKTPTTRGG